MFSFRPSLCNLVEHKVSDVLSAVFVQIVVRLTAAVQTHLNHRVLDLIILFILNTMQMDHKLLGMPLPIIEKLVGFLQAVDDSGDGREWECDTTHKHLPKLE